MSNAGPAARPLAAAWIISPPWDLLWFAATPLVAVPLVLAAGNVWAAERVWLVVMAFFSLGHHLPGFLRAYLDPELFARFKWRFVLVPPLLFVTALVCEARGLHGLKCIILLWATWHGLMQTYGFLRIYAAKAGDLTGATAGRDFRLTAAIFLAGAVLSDGRMLNLLQTFRQLGLPDPFVPWIGLARWGAVGILAAALTEYLIGLRRDVRAGVPVPWNKLLLLGSTAAIWGWTGSAWTDVLLGVAAFEIFHAVQYLAIVWVYNERAARRAAAAGSPWSWFRPDRTGMLCYVAAVAAFGALRLLPGPETAWAGPLAGAILATSTLLHYYFDGFIWKVRERGVRQNLGLHNGTAPTVSPRREGLYHAAKWACFFGPLGAGAWLETARPPDPTGAETLRQARTLAAAFPHSPDAALLLAEAALAAGDRPTAVSAARTAVAGRPGWARGWALLGTAELESFHPEEALAACRKAVELAPRDADLRFNLALVLRERGDPAGAIAEYRKAVELGPLFVPAREALAATLALHGTALAAAGDRPAGLAAAREAVELDPAKPALHVQLGAIAAAAGDHATAKAAFAEALRLDPRFGRAHLAWAEVAWVELLPRYRNGWVELVEPALAEVETHLAAAAAAGTPGRPEWLAEVAAVRRSLVRR